MKNTINFLIILILIISCNENKSLKNETLKSKIDTLKTQKTSLSKTDELNLLLQGKWKSTEDEKSIIIFEGKTRKDIYDGAEVENEEFEISNTCKNDGDKNLSNSGKDQYMSCIKSDMCWHIVNLDEANLTLNYTARGNDLNYIKIK